MKKIKVSQKQWGLYGIDHCPYCTHAPIKKIKDSTKGYTDYCAGCDSYLIVKKTIAYVD